MIRGERFSVLWGGLLLQSGGEEKVSEVPCLGIDVKKNKPIHNSSLQMPVEVSESHLAGALVKQVMDHCWQTVLSLARPTEQYLAAVQVPAMFLCSGCGMPDN